MSARILTRCPSTTPFGLVLGPTNPGLMTIALETLVNRLERFLLSYVTHAGILTYKTSTCVHTQALSVL